MSTFTDLRDKLVNGVTSQDVKVYVKTDLGREVLIYDSGAPADKNPESKSFIKYGIKVKNQTGKELLSYGEYPKTNYLKVGGIVAVLGTGLFITLKGLKSTLL